MQLPGPAFMIVPDEDESDHFWDTDMGIPNFVVKTKTLPLVQIEAVYSTKWYSQFNTIEVSWRLGSFIDTIDLMICESNWNPNYVRNRVVTEILKTIQVLDIDFTDAQSKQLVITIGHCIPDEPGSNQTIVNITPNEKQPEPVSVTSRKLPAMDMIVKMPCHCHGQAKLWETVQALNDNCKWSRERIADWIDKLHDDGFINAEFGGDQPDNDLPSIPIVSNPLCCLRQKF